MNDLDRRLPITDMLGIDAWDRMFNPRPMFNRFYGSSEYRSDADNDGITYQFDVPGVKKEDLSIGIDDGILSVHGKRDNHDGYHFNVSVSSKYDHTNVDAALELGVLTVKLNKKETSKIEIKVQ